MVKVLKAGHEYELVHRDNYGTTVVTFVNREPGSEAQGTTTQEVVRMLIDRTRYCNNCRPHPNNERIIHHLRMVIALHEARALERKVEKDEYPIEYADIGDDGHLKIQGGPSSLHGHTTDDFLPYEHPWESPSNHPKKD